MLLKLTVEELDEAKRKRSLRGLLRSKLEQQFSDTLFNDMVTALVNEIESFTSKPIPRPDWAKELQVEVLSPKPGNVGCAMWHQESKL